MFNMSNEEETSSVEGEGEHHGRLSINTKSAFATEEAKSDRAGRRIEPGFIEKLCSNTTSCINQEEMLTGPSSTMPREHTTHGEEKKDRYLCKRLNISNKLDLT